MIIQINIEEAELIIEEHLKHVGYELISNFPDLKNDKCVNFKNDGQENDDYCFVASVVMSGD